MREEVIVSVVLARVQNEKGYAVPGIIAKCTRCDHVVECYGESERSDKRACMKMHEECPQGGDYYYRPERAGGPPEAAAPPQAYPAAPAPVVHKISRENTNAPDVRELLVYRTYATAAAEKKMPVEFSPNVILSLLNAIDSMVTAIDAQKRIVAPAIAAWQKVFPGRVVEPPHIMEWLVESRKALEAVMTNKAAAASAPAEIAAITQKESEMRKR